MNFITSDLIKSVSDFGDLTEIQDSAYNIREDGKCAARKSTENIKIENKTDNLGIVITVKPGTKGEKVYIPACVTHGSFDDLVYNDFIIGEGADVTVIAGCGVHTADDGLAGHNGIHRFTLEKDAKVVYVEKHLGTGKGKGIKKIDPVTDIILKENSSLTMDTIQLGGVDVSTRKTYAVLEKDAKLLVRERIMTDGVEKARTDFDVILKGEGSGADLVSRSVARGNSHQEFYSKIVGRVRCTGHSECDAILAENGTVTASPSLEASHVDAELIHEAAIGKIAGEQILKLRTLGLTEEEAEQKIIDGFLQ